MINIPNSLIRQCIILLSNNYILQFIALVIFLYLQTLIEFEINGEK